MEGFAFGLGGAGLEVESVGDGGVIVVVVVVGGGEECGDGSEQGDCGAEIYDASHYVDWVEHLESVDVCCMCVWVNEWVVFLHFFSFVPRAERMGEQQQHGARRGMRRWMVSHCFE